jgi:ABC-2 type transport system ATP-binding protein
MPSIISIQNLSKTYASGFEALKRVNLDIRRGEIFAMLGPNGAGKTTLINIICGLVNPTGGAVTVDGHDIIRLFRKSRPSTFSRRSPTQYRLRVASSGSGAIPLSSKRS